MTVPHNTRAIEPKVKWQAIVTYLVGVVGLSLFNAVTDANLVTELPTTVQIFVAPLLPVIGGLIAGYQAKHQWRSGE